MREFGQSYAAKLKRKRAKLGDKWHLDEVFLEDITAYNIIYGEPLISTGP